DYLEAEAIFIIREAAAQFKNTVILFSGGKDSATVTHLAHKAFFPAPVPFALLHIDTGHNFKEVLKFRDQTAERYHMKLWIASVEDSIKQGRVKDEEGYDASRIALQSVSLLDAISNYKIEACIGGARRDEEKARAKERVFSHRDILGRWNPQHQRPELWHLYNTRKNEGEHFRVFPLSNWTELDVWNYIKRENIALPSLYFSHERKVFRRNGIWFADEGIIPLMPGEVSETHMVRFRTVGDVTSSGATLSNAATIDEVIHEILQSNTSERGGRADDKRSENSMEQRKREGYF
ncbi:MAG: sulfate adenylyltransferase subunit 2, partial [Chitinophagales bacterium]|nr:sulfate adenylyltransferase subunit 2 [Chitinophagales bacterium]